MYSYNEICYRVIIEKEKTNYFDIIYVII